MYFGFQNTDTMNFVWLDINASWSHSSLALPALHANLKPQTQEACNMQVVRGTIKSPVAQIVEELASLHPTYIFATAWLFNIQYLNEVLSRVHALCSPDGIFLGGPEFLGDNCGFLSANRHITAVFKGDGEDIFEEFISTLIEKDGKWRNLPGFEWIGTEYHSSEAVISADFPSLHSPESSPLFSWEKSFVQIETSRGCFNSCRFCVSGIGKSPVQNIPVAGLRERLNRIVSKGIRQVRVLDRTFNGNPGRALELLELFKEFSGRLNFHLEVHPALLFPVSETHCDGVAGEFCKPAGTEMESPVGKLKKALADAPEGLLHIEAGIQTLRQEVLEVCARKGRCAQAMKGLEFLIGCKNFEVHADLIAGLPGYTYDALVEDTLTMMQTGPAEIQLESLKLLPGTYFRNNATELGIRYSPTPPYEVLQTPHISCAELNRAMTLSRILDLWYNDSKWQEPFREIFSSRQTLSLLIEELHMTDYILQPLSLENKGLLLYRFCMKHVPQKAPLISLQWVKNGLSMKKEPACNFIRWEAQKDGNAPIADNPLLKSGLSPRCKFYHITVDGTRHWFAFNKEIERVAPCGYCAETCTSA